MYRVVYRRDRTSWALSRGGCGHFNAIFLGFDISPRSVALGSRPTSPQYQLTVKYRNKARFECVYFLDLLNENIWCNRVNAARFVSNLWTTHWTRLP